ncbi:Crp/Fnr family transcriptional regulator [Hymenobacter sp. UYP22]|uniref:Crp/Fnr family transcriptional regulator n=1 Tax=Hymenobacter sp. UYP22 TaxID=3156348 RepID=UPI0033931EA0
MPQQQLLHFLQSTGSISPAQAEEIAPHFHFTTLQPQEFLLRAGQISHDYLLLTAGLVRAFAHDTDGRDITTGFFGQGQVALEVSSFFSRQPSQENMQALTACAGWRLPHSQMNALFHTRNEFREFGRAVLVRGFAALKARMLSTITQPAAVRYEQLVRTRPEVVQHAPLKHIASYLGITNSSLSRIRKGPGH